MPIEQEFVYKTHDGQPAMTLHHWIETLPLTEQAQFRAAELRQFDLRDLAIARGDLVVVNAKPQARLARTDPADKGIVNDTAYVWKDEATAALGKGTDPVWLEFFVRYQTENGIVFETVNKSV
jgi:hypothetical protein